LRIEASSPPAKFSAGTDPITETVLDKDADDIFGLTGNQGPWVIKTPGESRPLRSDVELLFNEQMGAMARIGADGVTARAA
jgi:hypothetical protein